MTYWSDPRAKSQSLDPLAVGMNDPTIMQQPQQQPQQQPIGHSLQPNVRNHQSILFAIGIE